MTSSPTSTRPPPFLEGIRAARVPIIMEIKRQSSQGDLLFGDRSLAEIVTEYELAGATCMSVVTGQWFGGDADLLRRCASMTNAPLLRKDFVTRRSQLVASQKMGASAVLLTLDLLAPARQRRLVENCLELGMTPFVEVSTEEQIRSLTEPSLTAVAVNNKQIKDRERGEPDFARSLSLLPVLRDVGVALAVSASGIETPSDASGLLDAGFDALLIGTGLLRGKSAVEFAADLRTSDDLVLSGAPRVSATPGVSPSAPNAMVGLCPVAHRQSET